MPHRDRIGSRRTFLRRGGVGVGFLLGGCTDAPAAMLDNGDALPRGSNPGEPPIAAVEDLMREHGVVDRVMMLYDVAAEAIARGESIAPEVIDDGAAVVRSFIQDYHEWLEEEYLFPLFLRAGELTDLVTTLRAQHEAGYRLTDRIQELARANRTESRSQLVEVVRMFVRMYRAHAAHEDTVLFPALHRLVSHAAYDALGESFEEEEQRRFGPGGFEKIVRRVAHLEQALGVDDLDWFTPA